MVCIPKAGKDNLENQGSKFLPALRETYDL